MKPTPRTDNVLDSTHGLEHTALDRSMALLDLSMKLESELAEAKAIAGELLAIIKVNHAIGPAINTDKELNTHLKPWEDRLNKLNNNPNQTNQPTK